MKTDADEKETTENRRVNKGGRPRKKIHLDRKVTVRCTHIDLITIRFYAKEMNTTLSEYLRDSGLRRQVGRKVKALPKEVLQLTGTINHMAANLNQIAYKRNRGDELNALERAELTVLSSQIKALAKTIKEALQ